MTFKPVSANLVHGMSPPECDAPPGHQDLAAVCCEGNAGTVPSARSHLMLSRGSGAVTDSSYRKRRRFHWVQLLLAGTCPCGPCGPCDPCGPCRARIPCRDPCHAL